MKCIRSVANMLGISLMVLPVISNAQGNSWPKEFSSSEGKVVLYQPQPNKLDGNVISGVAAFSITPKSKKEPVFGALFFEGKLDIDREARTYEVESVNIPNIKFSDEQSGVDLEKLKTSIAIEIKNWKLKGSYDELLSTIEEANAAADKGAADFKNDPPTILYTSIPSVLINIDGDPILEDIPKSNLKRVANTPYLLLQNKGDNLFYLYGGDTDWFTTSSLQGGSWQTTKKVPKEIQTLIDQNKEQAAQSSQVKNTQDGVVPKIIVATTPTELVQSKGEPNFIPITGTSLLYIKNSDDNIFKDISSQDYYILKSGRWYASRSLESGWRYVPADKIPADFAKIPEGNEKDEVLASVPGTVEAKDALLDAQVPQMATVDRKTAGKELKVEYDGSPKFEPIKGTSLLLAENANKTVIKSGSKYYVVDNGVWFEGDNYNGPWDVSTTRPADIDNIPASSQAYNTKYVYIYDNTPDVVYVGYTPGYMGSYIMGPTIVYGTGWYYRPWHGMYYYPRPCTWGFNMGYNPWTGWSIGFGFSSGPFHFGFGSGGFSFGMSWGFGGRYGYGYGGGGWFGPPIYRPPVYRPGRPNYGYNRPGWNGGRPGRPGNNGNNNWGGGNQINIGGDVNINLPNKGNNIYNNKFNKNNGISSGIRDKDLSKLNVGNRPGTNNRRPVGGGNNQSGRPNNKLPNNVFADKEGNVFQKDKGGNWNQRDKNNWKKPENNGGNTPANKLPQLDRSKFNRERGNNRAETFRPPAPIPRPAPVNRGGGGGGRPAPAARPAIGRRKG